MADFNKTVFVIHGECPAPPHHGGRIDVFRRLKALKARGINVVLLCWYNPLAGESREQIIKDLGDLVSEVLVFPTRTFRERPWLILKYPEWVAQRVLEPMELKEVVERLKVLKPDAIILDGIVGASVLDDIRKQLKLGYFYRSHNIEHKYVKFQYKLAASGKEKFFLFLAKLGMLRLERRVLSDAKTYFDCSNSDLNHWKDAGFRNGYWLPIFVDDETAKTLSDINDWSPNYDVGYVGNLYAQNNVHGILWFMEHVVPLIRLNKPDAKIFIAGRKPVRKIVLACQQSGVELFDSPKDAVKIQRDCKVLVNPIFFGSGVNVKSLEMVFTPAELVTTTIGVGGLSDSAAACFEIFDNPGDFATAILRGINVFGSLPSQEASILRSSARDMYSEKVIDNFLNVLFDS